MLRKVYHKRFQKRYIGGVLLASAVAFLPAANGQARIPVPSTKAQPGTDKPDAELMLLEVYKELGANRLRNAMALADRLVEAYPNFRLGHLIRGDLLLMQTQPVTGMGPANAPEDKLKGLRDEAMARLKTLRFKPDPDLVPRAVLQLRDDMRHVLVMDAKRSRLYVYENVNGQLKFQTDYYVSQGKLGTNKLKQGDQKTPIGVYYITSRLAGARLPDFYGTGALPLNYPNEWDRVNGRSGSGIWLHGTPSDSFARPPLSSDGCVVLANPDLTRLYETLEIGKTPIVIADNVEFVNKTKAINDRALALKLMDDWRRDVESGNTQRLMTHYSSQFRTEKGEDRSAWFNKQWQFLNNAKPVNVQLRDLTLFFYPGREDMIVGTFTEESTMPRGRTTTRKRQYWAREGSQWRIVTETVM